MPGTRRNGYDRNAVMQLELFAYTAFVLFILTFAFYVFIQIQKHNVVLEVIIGIIALWGLSWFGIKTIHRYFNSRRLENKYQEDW